MSNIEQRIADIEARFAISELRSKYSWHTVRAQKPELIELFTEDGVFENWRTEGDAPVVVTGRKALAQYFDRMRPARRIPMATNEVTTINGDRAEGSCVMFAMGEEEFCGHYIDSFEKCNGVWLFKVRRYYPYWPMYKPDAQRRQP